MAAQVEAKDVTRNQVVELITAGRSGSIGLAPGAEPEDVVAEQSEPSPRRAATTGHGVQP